MIDLFSVHENAAAVTEVFEQASPGFGNDGGALAGDTRVSQRKMIPRFISAADQKWGTGYSHDAAGLVR
jgi:hypothetical protein